MGVPKHHTASNVVWKIRADFCKSINSTKAQIYMFSTYIFSYLALRQFYKRVNVWSLSRDTWQPKSFPKVSLEKSLGQTSPMWDRSTKKFSVISCPSLCHQCWGFSHMKEDMSQKCQSSGAPWKVWKTQKFRKDSRLLLDGSMLRPEVSEIFKSPKPFQSSAESVILAYIFW